MTGFLVFVDTAGERVPMSYESTIQAATHWRGRKNNRREERGRRGIGSSNDRVPGKLGGYAAEQMGVGRRRADRNK